MRKYVSLYTAIGAIGLFAALVGFSKTFFFPLASGTFQAPWVIYIHGAFAFAWVVLFLVQGSLIRAENWRLHISLGTLAVPTAVGLAVTLPMAGGYQVQRELALGLGDTAVSGIFGTFTAAILFIVLVVMGLWHRGKPETHKRLMLLATVSMLWPAWFRFRHYFPSVRSPEIWFALVLADSLILLAWLWDHRENGRVHPVLLWGGLLVIADHTFETFAFDSGPWRVVAKQIWALF